MIDLADITAGAGVTLGYSGNNSPGTLTVSDGIHTASIALRGNYSLANFTASSDGHGGTSVVDPPLSADQSGSLPSASENDAGPSLAAMDQQLALWSQHMASAFPSAGWGSTGTSMPSASETGGILPQLAQPVTQQEVGIEDRQPIRGRILLGGIVGHALSGCELGVGCLYGAIGRAETIWPLTARQSPGDAAIAFR